MAAAGGAGHRARPRGHGSGVGVRIVILYDPGAADWTPDDIRGVMKAVDEIAAIFGALGHEIRKVPVRHDMRWFQVARRADLVFNLCEGVHGKSEWEEHVVGALEFAGVPVTGASLWTLAACRRKAVANALLAQAGLPIPRWTIAQGKIDDDFPLPAIVKPAAEDASAGLDRGSVVTDRKALRARVAAMTEQFDEVLVQEYVAGREFNVGLVGSRTLPISEIDFARMPEGAWPILTYAGKWDAGSADDLGSVPVCPAAIPQKLADKLVKLAEAAWRILQGKGYGRVDLRVDEQGRAWVLDVNPNPDLNNDAGLSRMAKAAGWDYAELVRRVAEVALREAQGAKAARELLAPPRRPRDPRLLRATRLRAGRAAPELLRTGGRPGGLSQGPDAWCPGKSYSVRRASLRWRLWSPGSGPSTSRTSTGCGWRPGTSSSASRRRWSISSRLPAIRSGGSTSLTSRSSRCMTGWWTRSPRTRTPPSPTSRPATRTGRCSRFRRCAHPTAASGPDAARR